MPVRKYVGIRHFGCCPEESGAFMVVGGKKHGSPARGLLASPYRAKRTQPLYTMEAPVSNTQLAKGEMAICKYISNRKTAE